MQIPSVCMECHCAVPSNLKTQTAPQTLWAHPHGCAASSANCAEQVLPQQRATLTPAPWVCPKRMDWTAYFLRWEICTPFLIHTWIRTPGYFNPAFFYRSFKYWELRLMIRRIKQQYVHGKAACPEKYQRRHHHARYYLISFIRSTQFLVYFSCPCWKFLKNEYLATA